MNILGISAFYHDSAAVLVQDGEVRAAAQEERFTRKKHDNRFPFRAIGSVLSDAGISKSDLNCVVFYEKPKLKFDRIVNPSRRARLVDMGASWPQWRGSLTESSG